MQNVSLSGLLLIEIDTVNMDKLMENTIFQSWFNEVTAETRKNAFNPVYKHLESLEQVCRKKNEPGYIIDGIDKALKLIETQDEYCETASSLPSEALSAVATETKSHPWMQLYEEGKTMLPQPTVMLTGALEGQFLQMLTNMQKAKTVLEIGLFTGYSALAFAEVLPDDRKVFTCDIDPYLKQFAERSFARSPHGHKIKICLGDARDTLQQLVKEKHSFDIIFLDADKNSHLHYYKTCLQTIMDNGLLNKGGTILLDNALFFGQVYSEDRSNETTPLGCCVRECLDFIKEDPRVQRVLVPIRDGILMVRRKEDMGQ